MIGNKYFDTEDDYITNIDANNELNCSMSNVIIKNEER